MLHGECRDLPAQPHALDGRVPEVNPRVDARVRVLLRRGGDARKGARDASEGRTARRRERDLEREPPMAFLIRLSTLRSRSVVKDSSQELENSRKTHLPCGP